MKKYLLMFFVFTMSLTSAVYAQTAKTAPEDFNMFFKKFNEDPKFQVSRVIFPLKYQMNNDDFELSDYTMAKDKYKVLKLNNKADEKYLKRTISIKKHKATIQQRGLDNGIYVDYIFELKDNQWFLKTWIDQST
ncbi:DUF4348 domain-containing protein [Flavobacterium quisquiliarum]|uniref:DUF4348 domain-containing protein n=1 Tax=Flavobacterium quisquiliarum TaxID=1834436 RepID=A0ABV8W076_9FLAO|nr:DUF4348 domain-containing protein [Flavobacterium quisquiliarum]MBW1658583.1 DUF4348 domain-containing protein [Flavobacterium quisquiliarum]NWL02467.1 hypothetical protein [Flavobacterium collinsii]